MTEQTIEGLTAKVQEIEEQLKSNMDKEKEAQYEEEKNQARKAALLQAMEHMTYEEKKAMRSRKKASDDEKMKEAIDDIPEEKKANEDEHKGNEDKYTGNEDEHKGNEDEYKANDEKEKLEAKVKQLTATVQSYENERSVQLIDELAALKAHLVPNTDEDIYKAKLAAKSFVELQSMYNERKDELAAMNAANKEPEKKHFGFTASSTDTNKLTSISSILHDGGIA